MFSAIMAALTLGMLVSLIGASAASANGVALKMGDVLAGVGNGNISHFDSSGKLLDTLETTSGSADESGMCFDAAANLYSTNFEANTMSVFDSGGKLLAASFGSGFNEHPESCVFDGANNVYVGQADGSKEVLKFDTSGKSLGSFKPETGPRGTDWIDLASDGCTLASTSEGSEIKAFNVCTNKQLTAFATGLPAPCFAHRILTDGSELVACFSAVEHVNSKGEVIKTYTPPGGTSLFALNLDPDGKSFWTANLAPAGEIWRINIASGEVLTEFSSGAPVEVGGLAIVGEVTTPPKIKLAPTTAENPVGTTHTVTATVTENGEPKEGVTVTFTVTGPNAQTGTGVTNAKGEATFTYKGEIAGTDTIVASFKDKFGRTDESNIAKKIWTESKTATCGKTTVGKTKDGFVANWKRVNNGCTLASKATATELTVYLAPTTHSGSQVLKGIVYADSKGKPGALEGTTTQLTFTSKNKAGWYKLLFPAPLKLAAGNYWIGVITGATQYIAAEYYDSVPIVEDYNTNSYTAGPSNPFGSFKTTNEQMSLYLTYTAG